MLKEKVKCVRERKKCEGEKLKDYRGETSRADTLRRKIQKLEIKMCS